VSTAWTRDVDEAIALYELVGSPTVVDGDRRPKVQHNTWSWECTVPTAERENGDALDAYAVCPICEAAA